MSDDQIETVIDALTPKGERMTNSEWVNLLVKEFDVSRTSAKEMLHVLMLVKREDNFKKEFNGGGKNDKRS